MTLEEKRDAAFRFALKTATAAGEAVKNLARRPVTQRTQPSLAPAENPLQDTAIIDKNKTQRSN